MKTKEQKNKPSAVKWESLDKHPERAVEGATVVDHGKGDTAVILGVFDGHATIAAYNMNGVISVPLKDLRVAILPTINQTAEEKQDATRQGQFTKAMRLCGQAVKELQTGDFGKFDEEDELNEVCNGLINAYCKLGELTIETSVFAGAQPMAAAEAIKKATEGIGIIYTRNADPVDMKPPAGEAFVKADHEKAVETRIGLPVEYDSDDSINVIVDIYPEGVRAMGSNGNCLIIFDGEYLVPQRGSVWDRMAHYLPKSIDELNTFRLDVCEELGCRHNLTDKEVLAFLRSMTSPPRDYASLQTINKAAEVKMLALRATVAEYSKFVAKTDEAIIARIESDYRQFVGPGMAKAMKKK